MLVHNSSIATPCFSPLRSWSSQLSHVYLGYPATFLITLVIFSFEMSLWMNTNIDLIVNDCVGQEILVTESVKIEQHVVNITVPACPGFVPRSRAVDIKESLFGRHVLQTRSAANFELRETEAPKASPSECTNPSICACGQTCTSVVLPCHPPSETLIIVYSFIGTVTCIPGTSPPDPSPAIGDCRNLASVLRLFPQSIGRCLAYYTCYCNVALTMKHRGYLRPDQELPKSDGYRLLDLQNCLWKYQYSWSSH